MADSIKDVLQALLNNDGVTAAAIVGRDGFLIENASSIKLDQDALGAVVASAVGASEMIGKDFEMGGLEQYLLEFEGGKAIIAAAGSEILVLITSAEAIIGSVRYAVKKNIKRLVEIL